MNAAQPDRRTTRLVRGLAASTFLLWLGAGALLPVLPMYLQSHGASGTVIGLAMGAFFAAGAAAQYPAGRLSDRRPGTGIVLIALLVNAIACVAFLGPFGPLPAIALRGLQGGAVGAAEVVSLALVGRHVLPGRRGSAYASIFGAQLAGLAAGPLLGSFAGVRLIGVLFVGAALASAAGCLPLLGLRTPVAAVRETVVARVSLRRMPDVRALLIAAAAIGLTTGVYETCWSLLLDRGGATSWQIGLSWSLFSVAFVATSALGGRLVDRLDRRRLVMTALVVSALLACVYPFVASIPAVITLGALEGVGVALAYPAVQSLLSQAAPARQLGHVQGSYVSVQTASTAVAAAGSGALFGMAAWLPFTATGIAAIALLTWIAVIWKRSAEWQPDGHRRAAGNGGLDGKLTSGGDDSGALRGQADVAVGQPAR